LEEEQWSWGHGRARYGVAGARAWKSHALLVGLSPVGDTRQYCKGHAGTNVSVNPPGPKVLAPAFEHLCH